MNDREAGAPTLFDGSPRAEPTKQPSGVDATLAAGGAASGVDATLAAAATDVGDPGDAELPTVERGHYRIGSELARGGMGRIFIARDRRLGRNVAVKEALAMQAAFLARFEREVRLTARLQHPGIVSIYEAGRWPTGEPFYAMRMIAGRPLESVLAKAKTFTERLALLPHVLAVAEAIAYAHKERIIHRDLKPANVLVGDFGETVVIDWGLAKDLDDARPEPAESAGPYRESGEATLTILGSIMGTPSYMPVEQANGDAVDERADVYAIGAILYEVLSGRPPYEGESGMAIVGKLVSDPPVPLAERQAGVPADLLAIVERAMARDAANRYPTARELADDLRRYQTGQLVASHDYSTWEIVRRWIRKHRGIVTSAAIAVVALGVLGVAAYVRVVGERNRAEAARQVAANAQAVAQTAAAAEAKRADDLTIVQARTALATDPTAAIAWLKALSPASARYRSAAAIAADAEERGVAWIARLDGAVRAVAATSDGTRGFALDATGALWEIDIAKRSLRSLGKSAATAITMAIDDAGTHAVITHVDGVEVWDIATGKHERVAAKALFPAHIAPEGSRVALPGGEGEVRVCQVAGMACTSFAPPNVPSYVQFADNASLLVSTLNDRLYVYDVTGSPRAVAEYQVAGYGDSHAVRADHKAVAFVDRANQIQVVATGAWDKPEAQGECKATIPRVVISPDGRQLACQASDVFTAAGLRGPVLVHKTGIRDALFTPANVAATAGDDGEIQVALSDKWRRSLRGHDGPIVGLAVLGGGKELLSGSADGTIRIWRVAPSSTRLEPKDKPGASIAAAVLSADGSTMAVVDDGEAKVTRGGKPVAALPLTAHTKLDISPKGDVVLLVDETRTRAWWPATNTLVDVPAGKIVALDGDRFALRRDDKISIADLRTGAEQWSVPIDQGSVFAIARDLGRVVVGSPARPGLTIADAKGVRTLETDVKPNGISLSADARWAGVFGTGTFAGVVRVCDLEAGTCVDAGRHERGIATATMSANGQRYVTAGHDNTLQIFDVTTRKLEVLRRARDLRAVALSPDGGTLVALEATPLDRQLDATLLVRDIATGDERTMSLPAATDPEQIVVADRGTDIQVRYFVPTVVYQFHESLPRDASLRAVLESMTPAVIDEHGKPTTRR